MSVGTHAARTEALTFRPARARLTTWRGHLWALVIALDFYLLSNPLVFEPVFEISLRRAVLVTAAAVVVSIPWLRVPRVNLLVAAFFVWGILSAFWSIQPGATINTIGLYATLAAIAIVTYTQVDGGVLALGFTYGGVAVSALSLYAFYEELPGAFYGTLEGTMLAGVGTNENILAYTITLGMAGWLALRPKGVARVLLWVAAGACMVYTVYDARSTTGFLTAGAVVAMALAQVVVSWMGRRTWSRRRRTLWARGLGAVAVGCIVAFGASGHGPGDFSSRMPFWRASLEVASLGDHLAIGYGWGAVWAHPWLLAPANEVGDRIYVAAGYFLTHGHNSFVDLVIELGVVGVALALAIVVSALRTATRRSITPDAPRSSEESVRSRFTILCAVSLLVFGITEPMLSIPLGFWALILLTEPATDSSFWGRLRERRGWAQTRYSSRSLPTESE